MSEQTEKPMGTWWKPVKQGKSETANLENPLESPEHIRELYKQGKLSIPWLLANWTERVNEKKLIERERDEARKDKARMDFCEDNRVQLNCTQGAPGNYHFQVGNHPSESSYRKAIDARMALRTSL